MADHDCDILIIGGGIAGAAVAAHLSGHAKVLVLEMENQPGYHSTGRSAALFSETYGNRTIRALSKASRPFLFSPPAGFTSIELVKPRPVLIFGHSGQEKALANFGGHEAATPDIEAVSAERARELCPVLRAEGLAGGFLDRSTADIEVHELHQGYIRILKRNSAQLVTRAKVTSLGKEAGKWLVTTGQESFRASIIINAAGAWADELGALAGAQTIGLEPKRRTAALVEAPEAAKSDEWPMILDVEENFYLKPDAGLLLLSPADETPTAPCDAQPDELDIAIAIDRLQTATTLSVNRIRGKWAGLRSFVEDRSPVVGYDLRQTDFFWLAALGGYGLQTAPALSALAARMVLRQDTDEDFSTIGLEKNDLSPLRIRERETAEP